MAASFLFIQRHRGLQPWKVGSETDLTLQKAVVSEVSDTIVEIVIGNETETETEKGSEIETATEIESEIGIGIGSGSGSETTEIETVLKTVKGRKKKTAIEDGIETATEIVTETVTEIAKRSGSGSGSVSEKKIVRQIGAVSAAKKEKKMSDAQEAALRSGTASQRKATPSRLKSQWSS